MSVFIIRILEGLFLLGVIGCLVTIPLAGWGYVSVLFEKDPKERRVETESQPAD